MEGWKSGTIPARFAAEPLLGLLFVALLVLDAAAFFVMARRSAPIEFRLIIAQLVLSAVGVLGLVWLWNRRRRRRLSQVLQDLAARISGAFVVVMHGTPRLCIARENWNGWTSFYYGSDDNPSYSLLEAHITPSPMQFHAHARHLLDRFAGQDIGEAVPTGDEEFDRRFSVASTDRNFALNMMDSGRRPCMERLKAFGNPLVKVTGGFTLVRVNRDLSVIHGRSRQDRDAETLNSFLSDAVLLVDTAARLSHEFNVEGGPAPT